MQERSIELQLHNCEEVDITPSKRTTLWNHTVGVLQMIYYRCYYVHHTLESVHHTLSLSLSLSDSSRPLKSASGSSAIFVGCTFLVLSDSCALLMLTNWLSSSTMLLSHVVCHVQAIGDQLQGHAAS